MATRNDDQIRTILDNTIFLLIPSFNPDGHDIVGDWLKKSAGTPYEGAGPPELYGAYIGHDNNRDGYMLSQVESQHWAKVVYQDWFPQVYKDTHQMGSYGSRITIPPKYDPINPHVDPLMWRTSQLLGGAMGTALEAEGVTGVESQVHYDAWFMASFHGVANLSNITSFHTESASARLIWPLYIHPQQIQPGSRGRPENKAQMTFPHPWPGGWWRMSDIARQQEIETLALVETMGRYRQNFLKNRALAASRQVERGAAEFGHVIPMNQHDPGTAVKFVSTLMMNGVEVHRAPERFTSGSRVVEPGDLIVRLDQPSRAFIKTMIEPMVYPDNEWTRRRDGSPLPPYDMASFTLADHMGVESFPLSEKITAKLEKLTAAPKPAGKITGTGSAGWLLTPTWNLQLSRGQSRAQEWRRGLPAAESARALGTRHVLDSGRRFDRHRGRSGARDGVRAAVHGDGVCAHRDDVAAEAAACRALSPLRGRQHGRRVDALPLRPVGVPVHARRCG